MTAGVWFPPLALPLGGGREWVGWITSPLEGEVETAGSLPGVEGGGGVNQWMPLSSTGMTAGVCPQVPSPPSSGSG